MTCFDLFCFDLIEKISHRGSDLDDGCNTAESPEMPVVLYDQFMDHFGPVIMMDVERILGSLKATIVLWIFTYPGY